jgi:beta-glucanase (GH16 family)
MAVAVLPRPSYTLPGGAKLGDGFHTYAIEWSSSSIAFYIDDMQYETQTPQAATGRTWASIIRSSFC